MGSLSESVRRYMITTCAYHLASSLGVNMLMGWDRYFNFGGVAPNATEESYMQTLCSKQLLVHLSESLVLPRLTPIPRYHSCSRCSSCRECTTLFWYAPISTGIVTGVISYQLDVDIGEWSLATAFNTTTCFLKKFGDAQKLVYSKGAGWVFWYVRLSKMCIQSTAQQWSC